jgi:ATP-dependent Lon protease
VGDSSGNRLVLAVCQRENRGEVTPEVLYRTGTLCYVEQVQRGRGGSMQLVLDGRSRASAVRVVERDGYLEAVVRRHDEALPPVPENPAYLALVQEVRQRATELGRVSGLPEEILDGLLQSVTEPGRLADLIAGYLEIPSHEKQMLLETLAVEERLRLVLLQVERQISILDAQREIKSQVQQELGDRQREIVLREQLKAIQRELGEGEDGSETDELQERLAALDLPSAARKEVDRELARLGRMGRESMEYQVVRTYLETIADLPWNARSEDHLDLAEAERILDEDHYGLPDVKDRVLEYLAVRQLQSSFEVAAEVAGSDASQEVGAEGEREPDEPTGSDAEGGSETVVAAVDETTRRGPILLFVGPPGVGKTSIAKSIAKSMGREYVRISLGGVRDEADIRGHRRTYVGAMPGRIIQGMKQAGTRNPVFLLDEVDKVGASYQGDPAAALLELLDPAQNDSFVDHYLGVAFDLSEVLFVATANFIQNIPGPLLDRMELVEFTGYTEREKLEIAKRFLLPRQTREHALTLAQLTIEESAVREIITRYTREAGVRQLERTLGKLARKVARRVATGKVEQVTVNGESVAEILGRPNVRPERLASSDQKGVATGMFYTPVGGDILFVEAATMKGKGSLVLTGQLGDVMKESAQAAWSYARSHAPELGIDPERFESDVHVHVPAGAIPKDGPSAGITIATALISNLSDRPVRRDVAMTGELTLTGRVLPIGGVKEKVLGAVRAGISTIILPVENEADLEDLPLDVRNKLEIHPVEDLSEVLSVALLGVQRALGQSDVASPKPAYRSEDLSH